MSRGITYVTELPPCDTHKGRERVDAHYEGVTDKNVWANMCEECFERHGQGLGRMGNELLVVERPKTDEEKKDMISAFLLAVDQEAAEAAREERQKRQKIEAALSKPAKKPEPRRRSRSGAARKAELAAEDLHKIEKPQESPPPEESSDTLSSESKEEVSTS